MILDLSLPLRHAYPCQRCGLQVRTVELTTGGWIIINDQPSPTGDIIPGPADNPNDPAQARIMEHPIPGDTRWSRHPCR